MSAAGLNRPGRERRPLDRYETPAWAVDALCAGIERPPGCILDPGCGTGAIAAALLSRGWPVVGGCDIDPAAVDACRTRLPGCMWVQCDFTDAAGRAWAAALSPRCCIGNPPYGQAEAFVRSALSIVGHGGSVIFLLRLGFLAGVKRAALYGAGSGFRGVYVLPRRPSFCHGGTDSADYGWIHWQAGWRGEATIRRLDGGAVRTVEDIV